MGGKWAAYVTISGGNPDGWEHYIVQVVADSHRAAEDGVSSVTTHIVGGYPHEFRAKPTAHSEVDFESGLAQHKGYSRFSIKADIADDAIEDVEIEIK